MDVGEAWDQDAVSVSGMPVSVGRLCDVLAHRVAFGWDSITVQMSDTDVMNVVREATSLGLANCSVDGGVAVVTPTERGIIVGHATHVLNCPDHHRHCC